MRSTRSLLRLFTAGAVVAAILASPAPARAAAALPSDGVILVEGHGWGHGRGLGQWGAKGQADAGRTWSQIVTTYYSGVTIGTRPADEAIRVLVEVSQDVLVTSDTAFTVRWIGGGTVAASDATFRFFRARHDGTKYLVEKGPAHNGPWTAVGSNTLPVRFVPGTSLLQHVENGGVVRYYRGTIDGMRTGTTSLRSINELTMQQYLYGAVPREMPATWATEAVKAQSVAARSYATYKRDNARADDHPFDICATTSCQVYLGVAYRSSVGSTTINALEHSSSTAAINATAGKVLMYNGKPILAEYSSSTGGYTAKGNVPYLAPVPDPWDEISPHHNWKAKTTVAAIQAKWPEIGGLVRLDVTKRNGFGDWGGRVVELTLVGTTKTLTVGGDTFRSKFAWPSSGDVRSNWFRVLFWRGELAATPPKTALVAGGSVTVPILVKNTGNTSWPVGGKVRLATPGPSKFADPDWISSTRPAAVKANATSPGKTSIAPNEVARFDVRFNAGVVPPGPYVEKMRVVNDDVGPAGPWFPIDVPVIRAIVGVRRGNTWYLHSGGAADTVVSFGRDSDMPVVGDWNGDGTHTPGVVRGNQWYLSNDFDPEAEVAFAFGRSTDRPIVGDWDGDGTDTPGLVRDNTWHINNAFDPNADKSFVYGRSTDLPVAGDWNGDGKDTPGVVRGETWYLSDTLGPNTVHAFTYGVASDGHVVGDWDGNGTETPGVVRGNVWHANNGFDRVAEVTFTFGLAGDDPLVGDWDGAPFATPALVDGNTWKINTGFDGSADVEVGYGTTGDKPVAGDWDGDGRDSPGIVRENQWYLNNGFDGNADSVFGYGSATDVPVAGDWDGDGVDTPGIVRNGTWYLNNGFDANADIVVEFGSGSGTPIVGDWNGDGKDTPGLVIGNAWHLNNDFDGDADVTFDFGSGTFAPVAGDWNADGVDSPGLVDGATWKLNDGFDGTPERTFNYGDGSEHPLAGAWTG